MTAQPGQLVTRLAPGSDQGLSLVTVLAAKAVLDPNEPEHDDEAGWETDERSAERRLEDDLSSNDDGDNKLDEGNPPAFPLPDYFGTWEQHTRGFGTRLMRSMGYEGGGLGRGGKGRTAPVQVVVLKEGAGLGLPGAKCGSCVFPLLV